MATFNGAAYVGEQLASIAAQTVAPCEVIVGDDGSTDGTLEIVEAFARAAPMPVRLIRRPGRLGYAENFLQAAGSARGDLIAFSDQDDVWRPTKLERVTACFADPEVMFCVHRARTVGPDLRPTVRVRPSLGLMLRVGLHSRLFVPHGSRSIFRRELLQWCPPADRPVTMYAWDDDHLQEHDEWAFFAAHATGRVHYLDDELSLFRRHEAAAGFRDEQLRSGGGPLSQLAPLSDRQLECFHRSAQARSRYLRARLRDEPHAGRAARFSLEADRYDAIAVALSHRRQRQLQPRGARCAALARAVGRGQYKSQARGGLGAVALAQDLKDLLRADR